MTTHQAFHRQVTTILLSAAVWINLALPPAGAFAGEQVQSAGSMSVPRRGHTATVLADGRVLILGGLDASGPLSAAEIFDPASKTFTLAGNLANPRYGHTATLLANGRVLIAGGQDASGPLATAEIFDPADTATPFRLLTAAMGAPRANHTATLRSDGTVLLAGGDAAGTAEIFDPVTESFYTPLLNMAAPRNGHTATPLADDNVFLVGGGTASIELFNAASNSFTLWPQGLSQIRSGHSSIPTTDGRLLVIGGDQTGSFELFDPVTGANPLSLSLGTPSTTANLLANSKILVLGPGVSGLFDETTSQLSALTDTNAAALQLSGHTATELPTANKQILVAGGIDNSNNLLNTATIYNPASIATDAGDYPPFSWVNITGQGFLPNEIVTNQVEQIQGPAAGTAYAPWGVNADTNGDFATTWQVFSEDLLNTTLKLAAVGQSSGLKAETTFTDASLLQSVAVGAQTPTTISPGQSATFTVTGSWSGSGSDPATLSIQNSGWSPSAPAGVSTNFSVNPIDTPSPSSSVLTINTTASTPPGTYTFTVQAVADATQTATGTLVVKKSTSTSVSSSPNPSTYGQSVTFTATVTGSSGPPTGTVTFKDGATTLGAGTLNGAGVATFSTSALPAFATHSITAVYGGDSNFNSSTSGLLQQVLNSAPLKITANSTSKTYGQTVIFAGTEFTSAGLQNGETIGSVTLTSDGAPATATVSGSPYSIVLSHPTGGTFNPANYALSFDNGSLTVNTKALTVTANNSSKTYGQTVTFAGTEFTTSGLINGDTVTSVTLTSSGATATATVSGSPYTIVPSAAVGTGLGNYTISYASGSLTINTKALTLTANSTSKAYGQNVTFAGTEFTSGALVNGDTVTSVTLISAGAVTTAGVAGSPYAIVPSAAAGTGLANYVITYFNGTLTVTPITITALPTVNNKVYDGNTTATPNFAAGSAAFTGVLNGDHINLAQDAGGTATFADRNFGLGKLVTVTNLKIAGPDKDNYVLPSATATTTADITKAPLTITAVTNTKPYDGNTTAAAIPSVSGLKDSDTVTGVIEAYATATAGPGKTLNITAYTVNDGNAGNNYAVSLVANTTGVINQADSATTVASSENPSCFGDSITFTATVTSLAGIPTGTVTFEDGAATLGTGTLDGLGVATFATTGLSAGSHTITAVYGGDVNFAGSTSVTLTQVLNPTSVGGTASASPNPIDYNTSTTITLSGNTGTIQWQSSPDGTTFTNISGETGSTLTTPNLTAKTYYRAEVTSGICPSVFSTLATVTINGTTPPTITCPPPVTVQCLSSLPAHDFAGGSASDNCDGTPTVTWVSDSESNPGSSCNNIITRTYQAVDACGNTTTCTQTITVNDTTAPTITCPPPVTVQCYSSLPTHDFAGGSASDNCGGTPTVTWVSDSESNPGSSCHNVITRTYQATDACGNMAVCTQIITVNDTTPPVINCPAYPISVVNEGQCQNVIVFTDQSQVPVTATDNCGGLVTITYVRSDGLQVTGPYTAGTTIVTAYATNSCGNLSQCSFLVVVSNDKAIASNFNGTSIPGGATIWFNAVLKAKQLGSAPGPVTIHLFDQKITLNTSPTATVLTVPDSFVIFDPTATCGTTTCDPMTGSWTTRVPRSGLSGNTFLTAFPYTVPAGGLPGGINPVSWSGTFLASSPGVGLQWQWGAAVYTQFGATGSINVKSTDDTKGDCTYKNSDHAGTPENFKAYVIGGARGGGGSNWTGWYSGTQSVAPCQGDE